MRSFPALALVLGVTGLGTACSGDGNGPSNTPPAAAFTPSCVLLVCTFADGSIDADGQLTAYTWDFGDGAAAATTRDAQHTYAGANTYIVTLTVTDNDGAAAEVTHSVQVTANAPPTAGFTSSCTDLTCSFTDLSSDGDGTVVGFHWDFGDGAVGAVRNPSHAFASAGTYVVTLTVTDDRGATGTLSQPVTVTAPQTAAPIITIGGSIRLVRLGLCYPATGGNRPCGSSGSLSISNTGGGTLNWTATKDATWLRISPSSGTAPSTMKVWVDGTGVSPGSYSGQITVSATGATNSPLTVTVRFTRR